MFHQFLSFICSFNQKDSDKEESDSDDSYFKDEEEESSSEDDLPIGGTQKLTADMFLKRDKWDDFHLHYLLSLFYFYISFYFHIYIYTKILFESAIASVHLLIL